MGHFRRNKMFNNINNGRNLLIQTESKKVNDLITLDHQRKNHGLSLVWHIQQELRKFKNHGCIHIDRESNRCAYGLAKEGAKQSLGIIYLGFCLREILIVYNEDLIDSFLKRNPPD